MSNKQDEILNKFKDAEKKEGQNVAPENLMTQQEIHEFGINNIVKYAKQEGYELVDGTTDLNLNPQIVLKKNNQLYFVIVKTTPSDGSYFKLDKNIAYQVFESAQKHNAKVLFAGLGLYCVGFGFTLVKNQGFKIDFRGFQEIGINLGN